MFPDVIVAITPRRLGGAVGARGAVRRVARAHRGGDARSSGSSTSPTSQARDVRARPRWPDERRDRRRRAVTRGHPRRTRDGQDARPARPARDRHRRLERHWLALVLRLQALGAKVSVVAIDDGDLARPRRAAERSPRSPQHPPTQAPQAHAAVASAIERHGPVDVLVTCRGGPPRLRRGPAGRRARARHGDRPTSARSGASARRCPRCSSAPAHDRVHLVVRGSWACSAWPPHAAEVRRPRPVRDPPHRAQAARDPRRLGVPDGRRHARPGRRDPAAPASSRTRCRQIKPISPEVVVDAILDGTRAGGSTDRAAGTGSSVAWRTARRGRSDRRPCECEGGYALSRKASGGGPSSPARRTPRT